MSSKNEKEITVVIPVFNREKFISDAIQSVIGQTIQPQKIMVIDDGSTDNTEKVVRRFSEFIMYLYQDNCGPSQARNTGILAATTEYISFLDSDDVWHPRKLEIQMNEFEKYRNLKIALGLCLDSEFSGLSDIPEERNSNEIGFKLSFGSSLMKLSVFEEVGLLDENLKIGEDTDWFYRAREKCIPISVHRDVVQFVRKHQSNLTKTNRVGASSVLKVLKMAKDRKQGTAIRDHTNSEIPRNIDELIEMWDSV